MIAAIGELLLCLCQCAMKALVVSNSRSSFLRGLLSNLRKGRDANFSLVPLGKGIRQFEYVHTGNDSLKFANSQQPRHLPSAGS